MGIWSCGIFSVYDAVSPGSRESRASRTLVIRSPTSIAGSLSTASASSARVVIGTVEVRP